MYLFVPAYSLEIFCIHFVKQLCKNKYSYMQLSLVGKHAENLQARKAGAWVSCLA